MKSDTLDTKTLKLIPKENYVIIELDNGKVNAINTPLLKEIILTLDILDKDDEVKGVILSGRPHAFSGGLDVVFLATLDEAGQLEFWESYMGAMQSLVSFSKPLVCALTGYAPAGATILALCTDYRVMGRGAKHVFGMHEFKLQMQIPELCYVMCMHTIWEKCKPGMPYKKLNFITAMKLWLWGWLMNL